jgi:hypothetical protein
MMSKNLEQSPVSTPDSTTIGKEWFALDQSYGKPEAGTEELILGSYELNYSP